MYPYTLPSGRACILREMTGAEEELLTNTRLMKSGDALNQVMRNCLVSLDEHTEVTITNVLDLLAGDRLFILVKLRLISLGDEVTVALACPRCRTTTLVPVTLEDLPVTPYSPEREYTTALPGSGRTVRWVPLDGHMEKRLVAFPDSYQSQAMLMRIREIDGAPPTKKTLAEMLLRDYNALYAAMLAAEGGIDTVVSSACDGCGTLVRTRIEGEKDFLYPSLG
jgi:hypothetical protein